MRIARAINRYLPAITAWEDPTLVTLTLPDASAAQLPSTINRMLREIPAIGRAIRRTDHLPLRALRKLECTYNQQRNDYHPHFHIVVEGSPTADALLRRWLALHLEAVAAAQDVRACAEGALKELFKYFTKLIAKRPEGDTLRTIAPIAALDVIFCAMKGRRVFQPMGFRTPASPTEDENAAIGTLGDTVAGKRIGESVVWEWMQELHDWVDRDTGEFLTGYEPSEPLRYLVGATEPVHDR